MLTIDDLKTMLPGIFSHGTMLDNPLGIHMTGSGRMLRWVACRGVGYHNWAIYCHHEEHDWGIVASNGDKVHADATIRRLVPCTDEAFEIYRR